MKIASEDLSKLIFAIRKGFKEKSKNVFVDSP